MRKYDIVAIPIIFVWTFNQKYYKPHKFHQNYIGQTSIDYVE